MQDIWSQRVPTGWEPLNQSHLRSESKMRVAEIRLVCVHICGRLSWLLIGLKESSLLRKAKFLGWLVFSCIRKLSKCESVGKAVNSISPLLPQEAPAWVSTLIPLNNELWSRSVNQWTFSSIQKNDSWWHVMTHNYILLSLWCISENIAWHE